MALDLAAIGRLIGNEVPALTMGQALVDRVLPPRGGADLGGISIGILLAHPLLDVGGGGGMEIAGLIPEFSMDGMSHRIDNVIHDPMVAFLEFGWESGGLVVE